MKNVEEVVLRIRRFLIKPLQVAYPAFNPSSDMMDALVEDVGHLNGWALEHAAKNMRRELKVREPSFSHIYEYCLKAEASRSKGSDEEESKNSRTFN